MAPRPPSGRIRVELGGGADGARAAARRRVRLPRQVLRLQAGQAGVVTLRLNRKHRRRLRRARRATLALTITVRSPGRAIARDGMRFRLRP